MEYVRSNKWLVMMNRNCVRRMIYDDSQGDFCPMESRPSVANNAIII